MCVVIDINCLPRVFDGQNREHKEFAPVKNWILSGNGKVVYGGTKYDAELKKMRSYLRLFVTLKRFNKIVQVDSQLVDKESARVRQAIKDKAFDDPHILGIFCVSDCKVFCSHDSRFYPHLQNRNVYPKGRKPPAIYRSSKNKTLLTSKYVGACCAPNLQLTSAQREQFSRLT